LRRISLSIAVAVRHDVGDSCIVPLSMLAAVARHLTCGDDRGLHDVRMRIEHRLISWVDAAARILTWLSAFARTDVASGAGDVTGAARAHARR
jgi:hypothetical protein